MESHEYVSWALASELPEVPASIGAAKLRLALVAMANHANADGIAFPSQQTLATEISGFARRDIQNALSVLEGGGHLIRVGKQGRSIKYRMACVDAEPKPKRTGYPVTKAPRQLTGERTGERTGDVTGDVTGDRTGYPVTNRREVNSTPLTTTKKVGNETTEEVGTVKTEVKPAVKRQSAHTLPADFTLTPARQAWAAENTPAVNAQLETDGFIDYWKNGDGADKTKKNWESTWRGRMRTKQGDAEVRGWKPADARAHDIYNPANW